MNQPARVVVVLGYSTSRDTQLHPIGEARVRHAAAISRPQDVVVLTGWARRPSQRSEAALMAEIWSAPVRQLVLDHVATTTVGNALHARVAVRRLSPDEVVVVTSSWHAPRARFVFQRLLGEVAVSTSSPKELKGVSRPLWELPRWVLLPMQIQRAQKSRTEAD